MRAQVAPPAGASAPTSPVDRLLAGQDLAPGPDRDVGLLATDRDVRIGWVRDAQQEVVERRLGLGEGRIERLDPLASGGGGGPELGDLGPGRRRAALDRLADALRRGVPLRLERLGLGEQPAALEVELERAVHERWILALDLRAVADRVRLVAEPLQADAHVATPAVVAASDSVQPDASQVRR